ncbi:MAG: hypothetical protein WAL61_19550 [Acidimicrobiales bacterium]
MGVDLMGKASRSHNRRAAAAAAVFAAHDDEQLVCTNCGRVISANETSFSTDWGDDLLVSCYLCAPALMEVLDQYFDSGRRFRDGWQLHCAGGVDCFSGYTMRAS